MRVLRLSITALVLGFSFTGSALAADPATDAVAQQTDALIASAAQATRESLQLDVDFDVMVARSQVDIEQADAELVADASARPATPVVDDNDA